MKLDDHPKARPASPWGREYPTDPIALARVIREEADATSDPAELHYYINWLYSIAVYALEEPKP